MSRFQSSKNIEDRLPARLTEALNMIAKKYSPKGAQMFIFGSFARSKNRNTSDLDIGVLWTDSRNPRIFTELYRDIRQLPTVRKIDLVDMEQVDKEFKTRALSEAIMLSDKEVGYEPK